jgi:hypothetical protein
VKPFEEAAQTLSRRELFQNVSAGIGSIALASLLGDDLSAAPRMKNPNPLSPRAPHFAPKAKNVIFLHMVGAPSQLDLFNQKPALNEHDGQPCPDKYLEGQRFAFLRGHPKLLGTEFKFSQHGQSGLELSELLPNIATHADEICLIKTLHTEHFNHAPAQLFFQTGFGRFGRPTLGAWANYGLGTENQDLPGFVVMITGQVAGAGNSLWGSGFLPTKTDCGHHQSTQRRATGGRWRS